MKNKLKLLFKLMITFVSCFIVIYLIVFAGAWRLFESGDPIFIEIGVALILSIFVFVFFEILSMHEKRIKALEERINELENKQQSNLNL